MWAFEVCDCIEQEIDSALVCVCGFVLFVGFEKSMCVSSLCYFLSEDVSAFMVDIAIWITAGLVIDICGL